MADSWVAAADGGAADEGAAATAPEEVILCAHRANARLAMTRARSSSFRVLRDLAELARVTVTMSLVGYTGTKAKTFPWSLSPAQTRKAFEHAEKSGLCRTSSTAQSTTLMFACVANALAVFDCEESFFAKYGYVGRK